MLGSGTLCAVASMRDSLFPNRDTRLKVEEFESIFRNTQAKAIAGSNHETGFNSRNALGRRRGIVDNDLIAIFRSRRHGDPISICTAHECQY